MNRDARILIAGTDTVTGAAIARVLHRHGYRQLVTDLAARPDYVFIAAGKSGGILANQKFPADLCYDNLRVALDLIPAAHRQGVKKLLYLGSSCIYPKQAPQPLRPESLLTGALEPTSAAYAMAKLAGITLCQAYRRQHGAPFITGIPADVFGPGTKFSGDDSHVIPSLMVKMHQAKLAGTDHLTLWGSGSPRREFTFADDLAEACLVVMREYDDDAPINLGSGETVAIRELAEQIRDVVGFTGELRWDTTRPDGAPVKWLETTPLRALGWRSTTPLDIGLRATYQSLLETDEKT
ncbi:MAG: GDP-L-fucose synthase [Verrucomicrobiota bacterium]